MNVCLCMCSGCRQTSLVPETCLNLPVSLLPFFPDFYLIKGTARRTDKQKRSTSPSSTSSNNTASSLYEGMGCRNTACDSTTRGEGERKRKKATAQILLPTQGSGDERSSDGFIKRFLCRKAAINASQRY